MYAVIRQDDQGALFVDGLTCAHDPIHVQKRVEELHDMVPVLPAITPIVRGPGGERFALVELRFIEWANQEGP